MTSKFKLPNPSDIMREINEMVESGDRRRNALKSAHYDLLLRVLTPGDDINAHETRADVLAQHPELHEALLEIAAAFILASHIEAAPHEVKQYAAILEDLRKQATALGQTAKTDIDPNLG